MVIILLPGHAGAAIIRPHRQSTSGGHLKKSGNRKSVAPTIIPRAAHTVSRDEISKNALKVLYRLHKAGHQAFLVGGCVRDALLGLHPKDFDVATDATPSAVRALFHNCRLIGRRFRLAHVRFGRDVIEVATFRAAANHADDDVEHDDEGRIIRDNVYGTIEEDVWRRDFTCNALYYCIADFSIWDFVGGVTDIRNRRLVLIGDADQRVREDPVRMLRAVRFAAKLDFAIDENVIKAIKANTKLLANVPAARLFDEFLKLFQAGHAEMTFDLLRQHALFGELFPATEAELAEDPVYMQFVRAALRNTDDRVANGQSVTPMFLLGVFLWQPAVRLAEARRAQEKMSESQSLSIAAYELAAEQQQQIALPRRFTAPMREMLALQPRMLHTRGQRAMRLLDHRRFRAAYDFMLLRAEVGEIDKQIADFWTQAQSLSREERVRHFQIRTASKSGRRRRRRRKRRAQPIEQR